MEYYWSAFTQLIVTPFEHRELIWGIVPLYFGLLLNETSPSKANFRTAIQTGFSFLWAGLQWLFNPRPGTGRPPDLHVSQSIHLFVTILVLTLGVVALYSGMPTVPQARPPAGPHALCQLFHDHNFPYAKLLAALALGATGCRGHLRSAHLAGLALRPHALPRKEIMGIGQHSGAVGTRAFPRRANICPGRGSKGPAGRGAWLLSGQSFG